MIIPLCLLPRAQTELKALVAPPIPASVEAQVQPAIKYSIARVTQPPPSWIDEGKRDGKATWRVAGHWIHLDVGQDGTSINDVAAGRDGSVYASYTVFSEPMGSGSDVIWPKEKMWVIKAYDPTGWYQDAKNQFYTECDEEGAREIPLSPYYFGIKKSGVKRRIGLGSFVKGWWPDDALVSIMVDADNRPCGWDNWSTNFLRYYENEKPIEIGNYEYFDATPNRTIVLTKEHEIFEWRRGSFLSAVHLPNGWTPISVNRDGDILLRFTGRTGKNEFDSDDKEVFWGAGMLHGNKLFPILFARPKGTEHMFWSSDKSEEGLGADGSFLFEAIGKARSRYYRMKPIRQWPPASQRRGP